MSKPDIKREHVAYQHIINGGISFGIETDADVTHYLEFSLSSMGIVQRCLVPVLETTPAVLRELADRLEAKGLKDPSYLSPKDAHIQHADGTSERVFFRDGKFHRIQHCAKMESEKDNVGAQSDNDGS